MGLYNDYIHRNFCLVVFLNTGGQISFFQTNKYPFMFILVQGTIL